MDSEDDRATAMSSDREIALLADVVRGLRTHNSYQHAHKPAGGNEMLSALKIQKNKNEATGTTGESPVDTSNMSFTGKIANWSARRRWWVISAVFLVIAMSIMPPGQL